MSVSKQDVIHIAKLARLKFSDQELEKYTKDLSDIVDFAETLKSINVEGVEPTAHILKVQNVFREDELKPSCNREELFKNAPSKDAGCITVPRVVE